MTAPSIETWDFAQVARALRPDLPSAVDWLRKRYDGLRSRGFPEPIPGMGRRWDPQAIRAWLDSHMPEELRPGATLEQLRALLQGTAPDAAQTALLDARAADLARGLGRGAGRDH